MKNKVCEKIKFLCQATKNKFYGRFGWKPNVHTIDETLDYILMHHCSASRYGDGEFAIIAGGKNGFQSSDDRLANRLKHILRSNLPNHIVCIHDIYGNMPNLRTESQEFNRGLLHTERIKWLSYLDREKEYYNAFFTRPYNMFKDKSMASQWFDKNKKIWKDQEILLVEGEKSRLGMGNDLFDQAKSVRRILCPAENAYEKYDEIFRAAKEFGENKLILIALGMTATVLAFDLAEVGYWAIDIGHIDIEYEWFLMGAGGKVAIPNKYVNEVANGKSPGECTDPKYYDEIILKI